MERSLKILVVDDDLVTLTVVRALLAKEGHEVLIQHGALGTSAAIVRERPDVVLVDVEMPGLSGSAIARLIRDRRTRPGQEVRCILHSSLGRDELERLAGDSGALGAIVKSGNADDFLREFRRFTDPIAGASGIAGS